LVSFVGLGFALVLPSFAGARFPPLFGFYGTNNIWSQTNIISQVKQRERK
jgi:hypothetical protein